MGGQVHDHADITDPAGKRALPARRDLEERAELAMGEVVAHGEQGHVVPLPVPDAADQAPLLEFLGQFEAARRIGGQGFLHQGRYARVSQPEPDLGVGQGRGGDHAEIETEGEQLIDVSGDRVQLHGGPGGRGWISGADDLDARQLA